MNRNTPRIIKTVRSSNTNASNRQNDGNTDVYEKKTVNVTHTVSSSFVPTHTNALPRSTRRSNRQITVNRRVQGSRGYTPIKRTVITKESQINSSNLTSSSFGHKSIVKNVENKPSTMVKKVKHKDNPVRYSQKSSNMSKGRWTI